MDEALVVVGLLVVADQDRAALLQPGDGALDDPTAGGMGLVAIGVELLFTDPPDVGHVPGVGADGVAGLVIVGLVEAEVPDQLFGVGALTTIASIVVSSSLWLLTFAPAITTPRGPPCCSMIKCFLVPGLALSVGFGPRASPPKRLCP